MRDIDQLFIALGLLGMAGYYALKKTSFSGVDIIKRFEGFRSQVYLDTAGHETIGYGHRVLPGEHFPAAGITKMEAEQLLLRDMQRFERAINDMVSVPLNQNQFDALTSLVFNIGIQAFRDSTLLKKLNAYDYNGALSEMARWNKITVEGEKQVDEVLARRRAKEQELFVS